MINGCGLDFIVSREEKDIREAEIDKLSQELTKVKDDFAGEEKQSLEEREQLSSQIQELKQQVELKDGELGQLTTENRSVKEELAEKNRINGKVIVCSTM